MEKLNMQVCVDAGSEYCPCHLAYTGDCVLCPMMQGKGKCECMWQGVCVYNNFLTSKNLSKEEREELLCKIVSKKQIGEDLYVIDISIPKNLCVELTHPGAYILLRTADQMDSKFNAPISVMNIDEKKEILSVVLKTVGVKTKNIINHDEVWVRAPYRNGIFGIKELKLTSNSEAVVIAKGLSQVTIIKVVKQLIKNNNHIEVFIDDVSNIVGEVVSKVSELGVNVTILNYEENKAIIEDYIRRNNVKLVYSAGNNYFNKKIMSLVDSISEDIRLVIANNNLISCGEGICGACTVKVNGVRVKSCKAQIDPRVYLREVVK